MRFDIIACVLALAVPLFVALACSIYVDRLRRETQTSVSALKATLQTCFSRCSMRCDALEKRVDTTTSAHLAGELAALAGDVESLAKTVRKNFGRVWAELHHDGLLERANNKQAEIETPEQVRERLRREHVLPRIGGAAATAASGDE
jgi:hypothetical protein